MAEQENIPPTMPALLLHPSQSPSSTTLPSLTYTPTHPTPIPTPSQYLLKVLTTTLTLSDLHPPPPPTPSPPYTPKTIPGTSLSGIILSTPSIDEHTPTGPKFKVGDEVIGLLSLSPTAAQTQTSSTSTPCRTGACADVTVALETELAFKPRSVGSGASVGVVRGGLGGWQVLFGQKQQEEQQQDNDKGDDNEEGGGFEGAGLSGVVEYSSEEDEVVNWEMERERRERNGRVRRVLVFVAAGDGRGRVVGNGVGGMVVQLVRARSLFGEGARDREGGRVWVCFCVLGDEEGEVDGGFLKGELGVDEVVDYSSVRDGRAAAGGGGGGLAGVFRRHGWSPADLVVDCVGGEMLKEAYGSNIVRDGGMVFSNVRPIPERDEMWAEVRESIQKRNLVSRFFTVRPDGEQLEKIAILVDKGEIRAFEEREMQFDEGREMVELLESRRGRGEVVVRVNYDGQ
ncbi:hypothetical protein FQN50_004338 [Emmonsiellopsis sp. PD_5]|nr:hypothetical protein FQN50_004338 [Emmonsiellopsis sp. PD_5]